MLYFHAFYVVLLRNTWSNFRGINFDNGQIVDMGNQEKTESWYAGITAGSDNNSKALPLAYAYNVAY